MSIILHERSKTFHPVSYTHLDVYKRQVKMVVEGVYSAKAALGLAKRNNVNVPIIEEVNKVLFEEKDPKEAVADLLLRERKKEHTNLKWEEE